MWPDRVSNPGSLTYESDATRPGYPPSQRKEIELYYAYKAAQHLWVFLGIGLAVFCLFFFLFFLFFGRKLTIYVTSLDCC